MNLFHEAKKILDKDGKVNALGPYGKGKLTGREVSAYFRRNKVSDPKIKKAVEVALDMGGAYDIAGKEIQKFYGREIRNSKEVVSALQYANEETFRDDLNDLEEGQFWGQEKMSKAHTDKLKKAGAVRLQKKEKGGESRITLPKGHKDIKKYMKQGYKQIPIESVDDVQNEGKYPMPSSTKEKKAFDALYKKMDGGPEHMAIKKKIKNQVKADDAFHSLVMKRVMSEKKKMSLKKIGKNMNRAVKNANARLREEDIDEAFSKTPKSGAEVAKMMMKSKSMQGFANKVKKMKTVTAVQLDKMLPDYVSGGDIGAMFEEITEGKVSDSIIRKDFPNVWAASAKDRTILKKFHAKVDTSNYKKQKEIYKKNIKSFMSGLNNEKLSSIMKKMTVKKGPMKGWMTDSVIHGVAQDVEELQESKMGDLLIDIQMGATAKELARDHEITIQMAKNFLADYYGSRNKPRKAPGLKKEQVHEAQPIGSVGIRQDHQSDSNRDARVADWKKKKSEETKVEALQKKLEFARKQRQRHDDAAEEYREKASKVRERNPDDRAADGYDNKADRQEEMADNQNNKVQDIKDEIRKAKGIKEEQVKPFFDTYKDMMQEEVANITVDKQNKISKSSDQNAKALLVHDAAKRMGLKVSMVGKHVRVKGTKKKIHDFMMVVIGKSSYGDPTEQDTSTPQIDKMLSKGFSK